MTVSVSSKDNKERAELLCSMQARLVLRCRRLAVWGQQCGSFIWIRGNQQKSSQGIKSFQKHPEQEHERLSGVPSGLSSRSCGGCSFLELASPTSMSVYLRVTMTESGIVHNLRLTLALTCPSPWFPSFFSFFVQSGSLVHRMLLLQSGWGFPPQISLFGNTLTVVPSCVTPRQFRRAIPFC